MPNSSVMDQLVRISSPVIAPLAPSQDTTSDQLTAFYRPSAIPFIRHSPLPVASLAANNAAASTVAKETIVQVGGGGTIVSAGVSSLNSLKGALTIQSPGGTISLATAGASINEDVVSATSSQIGAIKLTGDLGNTAASPQVVSTHLASPLPVNQGGSGSTSPSLVGGSSITITGSWPNQTVASSAAGSTAVNSWTYKALSGTVGISANTLTTIDSIAITFPSSGGPWLVYVQYMYYKNGGVDYHAYITDGTNGWGAVDMVTQNNLTSLFNGGFSPVHYANSTTKTFAIDIFDTGNSTIELTSQIHGTSPAVSNMQVTVFSST